MPTLRLVVGLKTLGSLKVEYYCLAVMSMEQAAHSVRMQELESEEGQEHQ